MSRASTLRIGSGAILVAAAAGAVMLYLAVIHDTQCELSCDGMSGFDFGYAAMLFLSWFVPVSVVAFTSGLAGQAAWSAIRHRLTG